jgi:hypothetical protein
MKYNVTQTATSVTSQGDYTTRYEVTRWGMSIGLSFADYETANDMAQALNIGAEAAKAA